MTSLDIECVLGAILCLIFAWRESFARARIEIDRDYHHKCHELWKKAYDELGVIHEQHRQEWIALLWPRTADKRKELN